MSTADRVLAAAPLAAGARRLTAGHLRVFAMHDVADLDAFERQMRTLSDWFTPVPSERVAQWFRGERALPDRAAWFTFDDGEPSTVIDAAPILHRQGIPATVFVCPGLIDSGRAPWWETVLRATAAGRTVELDGVALRGQPAVTALKRVPDTTRREIVSALAETVGDEAERRVDVMDLQRWREAGGDIGNHTWDHPCLDRCDPDEQRAQLVQAHEWLVALLGRHPRLFAYPNGDHTAHAESVLEELGYEVGLLFDHGLASLEQHHLRLSRLRLDSDDDLPRGRAVLSGLHSRVLGAVG